MSADIHYATGRRKTSSARVYLKKGKGDISVNSKKLDEYFGRKVAQMLVMQPLELLELSEKIDIVDVFRPSKEAPGFANEAVKIGGKVLWLQYGIQNDEAQKIAEDNNIKYISNRCIKQEYQKLFQKSNPVFPALKT